ncbi:hypothetical protein [Fulvimarina pelagi]|nr:hypothetical protein [Fulvimarina pelagi]
MTLLLAEVAAVETTEKDNDPNSGDAGSQGKAQSGRVLSGKERIDTIAQITRTLEKLMELKRAEAAEAASLWEDPAETERLSRELVKRLRILDRKRREIGATASGSMAGIGPDGCDPGLIGAGNADMSGTGGASG